MSDAKVVDLPKRPRPVFSIHVEVMPPGSEPLPGHAAPLGELVWADVRREDQIAIRDCLLEAADVIDPTQWEPTEHEGVFAHVDNEPDPVNDD
jgi:hypothetical protein